MRLRRWAAAVAAHTTRAFAPLGPEISFAKPATVQPVLECHAQLGFLDWGWSFLCEAGPLVRPLIPLEIWPPPGCPRLDASHKWQLNACSVPTAV
jgi:hypothetical protein